MINKIERLKLILKKGDVDAVLISSVANIIYLTGYSGFSYFEREAFLIISKRKNYLITDGRYSEAVSKVLLSLSKYKLLEVSSTVRLEHILKYLSKREKIKRIGIEENDLSVTEYKKIRKHFKTVNLKELSNLRIIKGGDEIFKIEKACRLADLAFDFILKKLKQGFSEKQIAFKLEYFIKQKEADISFPPIVAFGKNSSIPHHKTGNKKLRANSIVLLDFGVRIDNYCSDMTRTVFFGKANDKFKKMHQTVLDAQQKALNFLDKDTPWQPRTRSILVRDVDRVARDYITEQGFPTIPHSLGHGIGIEVHEPPRLSPKSKDMLKPGMVFSIEPGIYLPGYGGVRIEDLVVLENKGLRLLPHSPKHLIEI